MSNSERSQYAQVMEDKKPCEDNDCKWNPAAHPKKLPLEFERLQISGINVSVKNTAEIKRSSTGTKPQKQTQFHIIQS